MNMAKRIISGDCVTFSCQILSSSQNPTVVTERLGEDSGKPGDMPTVIVVCGLQLEDKMSPDV